MHCRDKHVYEFRISENNQSGATLNDEPDNSAYHANKKIEFQADTMSFDKYVDVEVVETSRDTSSALPEKKRPPNQNNTDYTPTIDSIAHNHDASLDRQKNVIANPGIDKKSSKDNETAGNTRL